MSTWFTKKRMTNLKHFITTVFSVMFSLELNSIMSIFGLKRRPTLPVYCEYQHGYIATFIDLAIPTLDTIFKINVTSPWFTSTINVTQNIPTILLAWVKTNNLLTHYMALMGSQKLWTLAEAYMSIDRFELMTLVVSLRMQEVFFNWWYIPLDNSDMF